MNNRFPCPWVQTDGRCLHNELKAWSAPPVRVADEAVLMRLCWWGWLVAGVVQTLITRSWGPCGCSSTGGRLSYIWLNNMALRRPTAVNNESPHTIVTTNALWVVLLLPSSTCALVLCICVCVCVRVCVRVSVRACVHVWVCMSVSMCFKTGPQYLCQPQFQRVQQHDATIEAGHPLHRSHSALSVSWIQNQPRAVNAWWIHYGNWVYDGSILYNSLIPNSSICFTCASVFKKAKEQILSKCAI